MPSIKPLSRQQLEELRQRITDKLGDEELRTLCFNLDVDYDDLGGEGKPGKARELVAFLTRRVRIPELIEACVKFRPDIRWHDQRTRIFICCKCAPNLAQELCKPLLELLNAHGHQVYCIQAEGRDCKSWQTRTKRIKDSDYVIVLMTEELARSEGATVLTQIKHAHEFRERQKRPDILLIRVAYDGLLPFWIHQYMNPRVYVPWKDVQDNDRVGAEILSIIQSGRLPNREPIEVRPFTDELVTEDGTETAKRRAIPRPSAQFDWRRLNFENPNQVVKLRDELYVRREADDELDRQVEHPGTVTTIRAPRQTGKSSLLVRGVRHALETEARAVMCDLQMVDKAHIESPELFLRYMADSIVMGLGLDFDQVRKMWEHELAPQSKLTYLMENYVLPAGKDRLVLAMDEVDRLLATSFRDDFFSILRVWCNNAAHQEPWDRLSIVMVIATDPWLFIQNARQSPFNVGLKLKLEDFSKKQVQYLNRQHNSPVEDKNLPQFMDLLNGHPYLTRQALYTLVHDRLKWSDLDAVAINEEGPFGEHLRYYDELLHDQPKLQKALEQIIVHNQCSDKDTFHRLERAGLVKGIPTACECRCDLYRRYFKDRQ